MREQRLAQVKINQSINQPVNQSFNQVRAHCSLQLVYGICKCLVENQHAVGLGHSDHVHSAAVPAGPLKLQVPSTCLHQALGSFYAQPCCAMPAGGCRPHSGFRIGDQVWTASVACSNAALRLILNPEGMGFSKRV